MNANQLATRLDLDYKTVRHHLDKLEDNQVVTSMGEEYGKTYFLTERMEQNLDVLAEVTARADLEEEEEEDEEEEEEEEAREEEDNDA